MKGKIMVKLFFIISIFLFPLGICFAQGETVDCMSDGASSHELLVNVGDTVEAEISTNNRGKDIATNIQDNSVYKHALNQINELLQKEKEWHIKEESLSEQLWSRSRDVEQLEDSISKLERDIQECKRRNEKLEHKLIFADTIIARLSNDCLRRKYDKVRVQEAISNFNNMYSHELQAHFIKIKELLEKYWEYSKEIKDVLDEAQSDEEMSNPFSCEKKARTYINKIKQTNYYKECYNADWTIMYLNGVIDKSLAKLNALNWKNYKGMNLLEVME